MVGQGTKEKGKGKGQREKKKKNKIKNWRPNSSKVCLSVIPSLVGKKKPFTNMIVYKSFPPLPPPTRHPSECSRILVFLALFTWLPHFLPPFGI